MHISYIYIYYIDIYSMSPKKRFYAGDISVLTVLWLRASLDQLNDPTSQGYCIHPERARVAAAMRDNLSRMAPRFEAMVTGNPHRFNGGFNGTTIHKWRMLNCHVWVAESNSLVVDGSYKYWTRLFWRGLGYIIYEREKKVRNMGSWRRTHQLSGKMKYWRGHARQ